MKDALEETFALNFLEEGSADHVCSEALVLSEVVLLVLQFVQQVQAPLRWLFIFVPVL